MDTPDSTKCIKNETPAKIKKNPINVYNSLLSITVYKDYLIIITKMIDRKLLL